MYIKAVFSVQDKKIFHKKHKVFMPAGVAAVTTYFMNFSFFYNGPYVRFIYLEIAVNYCCRP